MPKQTKTQKTASNKIIFFKLDALSHLTGGIVVPDFRLPVFDEDEEI